MTDDEKIAKYLAENAVTKCPDGEALGARLQKQVPAGTMYSAGSGKTKWNPIRDTGKHERFLNLINLSQKHYRRNNPIESKTETGKSPDNTKGTKP